MMSLAKIMPLVCLRGRRARRSHGPVGCFQRVVQSLLSVCVWLTWFLERFPSLLCWATVLGEILNSRQFLHPKHLKVGNLSLSCLYEVFFGFSFVVVGSTFHFCVLHIRFCCSCRSSSWSGGLLRSRKWCVCCWGCSWDAGPRKWRDVGVAWRSFSSDTDTAQSSSCGARAFSGP